MTPWISIIVPSFNQGQYLEATLASLLAQEEPGLEIIVVDGGSDDDSGAIIRRFADRLAWWVSEPDRGQSHALNKGFAHAHGEWLGWLNSDDLLLPGALRALREHVRRFPDKQWWIGGGYFINEKGARFRDYGPPLGLRSPIQLADWVEYWFAQPSTFFRCDLFDGAGRSVREDLHWAMDVDLWLRFLKQAPPGFIEQELSVYRHHPTGKTHAMSVQGEAEIVKVVADHLGLEAALDRVRNLAAQRNSLETYQQNFERFFGPFLATLRWYRRLPHVPFGKRASTK